MDIIDILIDILNVFIYVVIFIFSCMIHEISHGYFAHLRGDDTAKSMGRLTLNPLPSIELFGSIIFPITLLLLKFPIVFGWSRPVPIDYRNLKKTKLDVFLISLAGPAANLLLALLSGLGIRFINIFADFKIGFGASISYFLWKMLIINIWLAIINFLPVPSFDGAKIAACFMPKDMAKKYMNLNSFICWMIVLLLLCSDAVFVLLYPFNFLVTLFSGSGFQSLC
ncbi:MAG: site-2 protease family protein [Endomicrobium sp.]|jgi:Zn-dependent protease|nr:site-2 protease family protein [Endomicrobium sp.]